MADEDTASSWTIKNFPVELRKRVVKAADAADMTIPEWLTPVLLQALDQQALNGIIPPRERVKMEIPSHEILPGLAAITHEAREMIRFAGELPADEDGEKKKAVLLALAKNLTTTGNFWARVGRGLTPREPGQSKPRPRKPTEIEGPPAVPMIGVDKAS